MKTKAVSSLLLVISGVCTYFSFNLFQSPPSLGWLFHFYIALAIIILAVIIGRIHYNKPFKIMTIVPFCTAVGIIITLCIFDGNNKATMFYGFVLTFLCLVAHVVTLLIFLYKKTD